MERFTGLIGVVVILGIAFLLSNNKKAINYRLVISGIGLQLAIALLVLKVTPVTQFFAWIGRGMGKIEQFATQGAAFAWGGIIVDKHDEKQDKRKNVSPAFILDKLGDNFTYNQIWSKK